MSDYDGEGEWGGEGPAPIALSIMIKMWLLENSTFYQGWRVEEDSICRGTKYYFDIHKSTVTVAYNKRKYNDVDFDMYDPMFFAKLGARIMEIKTELTPTLGSLGIL